MANELGQRIRKARERREWTQQQLALAVGVGSRTVGGWERGETVPLNRIGKLEEILGADVNPDNDKRAVRVTRGQGVPTEINVMIAHWDELTQLDLMRLSRMVMDAALEGGASMGDDDPP